MTGAFDRGERRRLGVLFALVGALHVAGWGLLFAYGSGHPELVALGSVAYFFGLRHAFDADHISAIDNTTRKLLQERRRPMAVGFFFSLGHSTVVLLITLALGLAVSWLVSGVVDGNGHLRSLGRLVGTSVSGSFLLLIGVLNLVILLDIVRVYRRMRRGEYDRGTLHHELVAGGIMSRLFGRLFGLIRHSWQMYPIGFLFGLGFDTASEVALLAISASAAAHGMPLIAILSLPLIFAAGMSMMDTADGAFMAKAYGWAFSNPVRRVFYNLTVTGLSVFVALFVGGVELSQIAARELHLDGQPWAALAGLDLGLLGFLIVGAFVATWAVAFAVYRLRRVEERWSAMVAGD
jgi:high-affinity nickel-transport protein